MHEEPAERRGLAALCLQSRGSGSTPRHSSELHRRSSASTTSRAPKIDSTLLVVSRSDRPYLPIRKEGELPVLAYEEMEDAYARRVLPTRAILLPIKRAPHFGRDVIFDSVGYVLRDWLAK